MPAREHFPGLLDKTYLDAACVSLAPRPAVEAIEKFLGLALACPAESATAHHLQMDEMRAAARPEVARLLNAQAHEIALVESTSHALALVAQAIPLSSGDRVLVPDLEFMQVAIPWTQKRHEGIAIDTVKHCRGEIRVEAIADRLTPRTRVLAMSTVQWSNGFRCDLDAIARLCRERDVWLVADAIQQLGAIPLDVAKTPVDIVVSGGHKWLNAPFGCGFLYLRREAQARLRSPLAGYLSVVDPPGGWGAYFADPATVPVKDYEFVPGARRYEHGGTANYPGAVGLAASLRLIHEIGQDRIAAYIRDLTSRLIAGLQAQGIEVVTPLAPEYRSGIVTFSVGTAEQNSACMRQLLARRIFVSMRYTSGVGGVRISCHFFNSEDDIDALLNALELARRSASS